MKFGSGYILGAATVVSLAASFFAGVYTGLLANEKKNEQIEKLKEVKTTDVVNNLITNKNYWRKRSN